MQSQLISKVISIVVKNTRAYSARSSTYIIILSRFSLLRLFFITITLTTYISLILDSNRAAGRSEELLKTAHIQPLIYNHIVNLPASLDFVHKLVPLPECI